MPLFSIIIPVYNVEPYIRKCLNTVLSQDFNDWEALLIDDGSTDGSGSICDEFASRDYRFRVFHKINGGVSTARNIGLDNARGEWIWFVDSDDYITNNALSTLNRTIKSYDCDTIFFEMEVERNGTISKGELNYGVISNLAKNDFLCKIFSYVNPTMLFKAEYFRKYGIKFTPGIRMAEDLEVQYKYLIYAQKPVKIYERLYINFQREGSAMHNPDTDRNNMKDCLQVCNHLLDYIKSNNIVYEQWLSQRIRILIKSGLQSAANLPAKETFGLRHRVNEIVDGLHSAGYKDIDDMTIKIAKTSFLLYIILLKVFKWLH